MKLPNAPQVKRIRPQVEILVKDVPVTYGADDHFLIRVYEPIEEVKSRKPRPALIVLHGGGWIHGHPEVDEGTCSTLPREMIVSNEKRYVKILFFRASSHSARN